MELARITAEQVAILFILICAGYLVAKMGVIEAGAKKAFSNLLVYLIIPAMILNSYMTGFNLDILNNLLKEFVYSTILLVVGIVVTLVAFSRNKEANVPIIKFTCSFSNAAYMGFPLIQALYGSEGLLYASAFVTMYNILLWTVGYAIVSRKASLKEIAHSIITTPVIMSVVVGLVIFLCRIPIPHIVKQPISYIGSMNTSLSMIVTGILIASSNMGKIIRNKNIPKILLVRMLIIPALCLGIFKLMGLSGTVANIAIMLESCPCAAITSVFAVQFGYDEDLAAGAVVISTLISIVTLPVVAYLVSNI